MRIRDVACHVLEAPLSRRFGWSLAEADRRTAMLVEVVAEDGTTGWGESYGPARANAAVVEHYYKPRLVGADPLATEAIWQDLYALLRDHGQKGLAVQALSGVDIALWDLKGKLLGRPVHRLMGGPIRERVRAYATGLYSRPEGDPALYLAEEAAGYAAEGFSAVKLKVGYGVREDVRNARAVREAVGPDVGLMVDADHAYDAAAAVGLGRRIADLDVGWFEEPVPPEDLRGYAGVRRGQPIPVAGGEREFTRFGFRELFLRRCVDVAQPDTCAAGGLSECEKIADMANAFGVRYVPHVWGTGVALAASLQLLAVLPHNPPCRFPLEPLLELDRTEHPIRRAVLKAPIEHERGWVAVPTGPGLGVEVDREALERFRAA
jgi:D-galactarolactone cycloisomerase